MLKNSNAKLIDELDLEKSIKVNELSRLIHDVKLPITVLQSISDILFKLNEQEEMENYIFMLASNIKYLTRIIESLKDEIIDLDNRDNIMLETDIIGYTDMLVDSVRPVCEVNNININFECDFEYYEYTMNYRFYERIILNVLKNSVRHAKNCTDIIVKMCLDDNKIITYIRDNGQNNTECENINIMKEDNDVEKNFIEKSTGEGLYIITSLAKKLNAKATYAIENDGMRFSLELITKGGLFNNDFDIEQIGMEQLNI